MPRLCRLARRSAGLDVRHPAPPMATFAVDQEYWLINTTYQQGREMKIFLSWSGARSKAVADVLYAWLPQVIQAVDPWMSSEMEKGRKWSPEISDRLGQTPFGIICLTRENLSAPWILFEAGALSKTPDAYTWTFLYELSPTDVQQPLAQFQHTVAEKQDVRKLLHTINEVVRTLGEKALSDTVLDKVFETFWPELQSSLASIPPERAKPRGEVRSERELLEEVLELVRGQERRLLIIESTRVPPLGVPQPWSREEYAYFMESYRPTGPGRWPPAGLQLSLGSSSNDLAAVSIFIEGTHSQAQQFLARLRNERVVAWAEVFTGPEVKWEIRVMFRGLQDAAALQRLLLEVTEEVGCTVKNVSLWAPKPGSST